MDIAHRILDRLPVTVSEEVQRSPVLKALLEAIAMEFVECRCDINDLKKKVTPRGGWYGGPL